MRVALCRSSCRCDGEGGATEDRRAPRDLPPSSAHRAQERRRRRRANADAPRKSRMSYRRCRQTPAASDLPLPRRRMEVRGRNRLPEQQDDGREHRGFAHHLRGCMWRRDFIGDRARNWPTLQTAVFGIEDQAPVIAEGGTNRPMEMLQGRLIAPIHHLGQHAGFEVALNLLADARNPARRLRPADPSPFSISDFPRRCGGVSTLISMIDWLTLPATGNTR